MINFADMSGKIKIEMPKFTWWDWFLILGFISASLAVSILKGEFSTLSFIAGTCSILCVIFGAKGNMLNFLFGLVGSIILGYIMFGTGVVGMAVFYLLYNAPMQIVGWFKWKQRRLSPDSVVIKTRWMSLGQRILMIISTLLLGTVMYFVLKEVPHEDQPLSDAAAVAVAAVTQFVLVFAFIEQWFLWIVLDIVMSIVWIVAWQAGKPHAAIQLILQLFYLINAFRGVYLWSKLEKK